MRVSLLAQPSAAALLVAGLLPTARGYEVVAERGVVFGVVDGYELLADVFRPLDAEGLRPGLVFVHGGGWVGGRREQFAWHAEECARRGYVAITVDYRLMAQALYPAALDDCQLAVRWLRSRAAEWRLDPARVGAVGSSSGGHLAACLGVRDTRAPDAPLGEYSSRVTVVVDVHGIHDFLGAGPLDEPRLSQFLGGGREERPELWRDGSPIEWVDAASAAFFLTHDPDDRTVAYPQTTRFAAKLIEAGRPVEFLPTPGSGHGFVYNPRNRWTQRLWPPAVAWLDRWLQPAGEPAG